MRRIIVSITLLAALLGGCSGKAPIDRQPSPLASKLARTGAVELDRNNDGKIDDDYIPASVARSAQLAGKQDALGFVPENAANKGVAYGYAGLGADGKVPSSQLPAGTGGGDGVSSYNDLTDKPTIPTALSQLLDDPNHRLVTDANISTWSSKQDALGFTPENAAKRGVANGYAALGADGKVPSSQLPAGTGGGGGLPDGLEVGTAANNLVQLDSAGQLPAVSGANLTGSWFGDTLSSVGNMQSAIQALATNIDNGVKLAAGVGINFTDNPGNGLTVVSIADHIFTPYSTNLITAAQMTGANKYYGTNADGFVGAWPLPGAAEDAGETIKVLPADPQNPKNGEVWINTTDRTLGWSGAAGVTKVSGAFTPWDTTPDAFSFVAEIDIAPDTDKVSNAIVVSGINHGAPISVTGDYGAGYKVGAASCTATPGTVVAGDAVAACVTSSGVGGEGTSATVTIGGVSGTYSLTTVADGGTPSADICSATGLLLSWHAEGTAMGSGGESGCSVLGGGTWTANGTPAPTLSTTDKSEGATAVSAVKGAYFSLSVTQNFPTTRGTIIADVRIDQACNYCNQVRLEGNSSNYISLMQAGTSPNIQIIASSKAASTSWPSVTNSAHITAGDGWYRIKYQWNTTGATTQKIEVWPLNNQKPRRPVDPPTVATSSGALSAFNSLPNKIWVGNYSSATDATITQYVDMVQIYATSDIQ